jgi:macrolide-specific efflux system membrane fusion protein
MTAKKSFKKIYFAAAIIAAAGAGWWYYSHNGTASEVRYASAEARGQAVTETVETTGQVEPLNRVEIAPPSSGRIEKLLVHEGDSVKSGDVLALMSSTDRVAILDAARSMDEEQYKYWQDSYKPIKVMAPLAGNIILKNVVEGQTVSQGTVLYAMSDYLIVMASVDESDIGKVKVGQRAKIILDAYQDKPVAGQVFQILSEGKNVSNVITYGVKIRPNNVPSFFKSQMTANISIEVSKRENAVMIPAKAITVDPAGNTAVIIALRDGKPVYQRVETGTDAGGKVEVTSGLEAGENVYFQQKGYKPQQAEGGSPLMPSRPGQGMSRNQRRAVSGH